jgi:hypothetical protein
VKKMIEKPCNIKKQGDKKKEKHKSKPETTCPGKAFGKMTGVCPFKNSGCHERRGDQPESENKPYS